MIEISTLPETNVKSAIDIGVISERYSQPMKKKQPTLFPLRFQNNKQRETVRQAAKLEGRSMNNYILRIVIPKAAADLQSQAESAISSLA